MMLREAAEGEKVECIGSVSPPQALTREEKNNKTDQRPKREREKNKWRKQGE